MDKLPLKKEFVCLNIALMTVSDSRNFGNDKSGDLLSDRILSAGHILIDRTIVKDQESLIKQQLQAWIKSNEVDVIITTGGTGLTGRDVSIEAHKSVYEKEIVAFGTIFSVISMKKIGTSAIQSRACAGVALGKFLFALPGSPSACQDAWDEILIHQLDYRHEPCNFVEIIPRLEEHKKRK